MAPRASWRGFVRFSVIQTSVGLFPANTTSEHISFHTLHRQTGNRLRQRWVDTGTGEVVDKEDQARGFEVSKGEYVVLDDEELESLKIESNKTIVIESFVPPSTVDPVYLDGDHYMAPSDRVGLEAFALLRDAMREKGLAALGRVVLYGRERALLLEPRGNGILADRLRFDYEVRSDRELFAEIEDVELSDENLELALQLVDNRIRPWDPSRYEDRYEQALVELIKAKQEGRTPQRPKVSVEPSNVVNLAEVLRAAREQDRRAESATPRSKAASRSRKSSAPAKSAARRSGGRKR